MHIVRYKNSREAVLDSEVSKQEVKEFVVSRPCSRCKGMSRGERVSRYLQPVGVTFICLTNMALPAFSLYAIFSGFIWQCPQNCHTGSLTGLHATFFWHCLHKIPLLDGQRLFQDSVNPLLGCEPTTSHLLVRHLSPPGHSVLGGTDSPLPKAHVTTRLERGNNPTNLRTRISS